MDKEKTSILEERIRELENRNEQLQNQNVQLQENLEASKKNEQQTREIGEALRSISNRFIRAVDIDQAIHDSLADMGQLTGAGRAYLFLFSEDGQMMDNTHEWCAEGVKPEIDNLKNLPAESFPWWMERLLKGENIHIKNVADMPEEAKVEKDFLEAQDIKSLLVLPVYTGNQLKGFTGFDDVIKTGEWTGEHTKILQSFSQIIINALERRQFENQLKEKTDLLENITDNIFDMVSLTDIEGNFIFAGKSHEIFGYDVDSLIGTNILDYVHPDDYPYVIKEFNEILQSKDSSKVEHRIISANGVCYWIETLGKLLKDEDGNPKQLLFTSHDITERKEDEKELLDAKKRAEESEKLTKQNLFNIEFLADCATHFVDKRYEKDIYNFIAKKLRELNPKASIVTVSEIDYDNFVIENKAFEASNGSINTFLNDLEIQLIGQQYPLDDRIKELADGKLKKLDGGIYELTFESIPKDIAFKIEDQLDIENIYGISFILNNKIYADAALIFPKGKDIQNRETLETFVRQASLALKRRESEQELIRAKEKAEESNRLKSAFLANMSHEIRTPMNGIMGFSKMLKEIDYPREEQQKFLDIIYSRTNQLLQIMNDIVDASMIEADQLQLEFQNFCLNDVIEELYNMYLNELESREKEHIALKVHKGLAYKNSYIHTDLSRLRQIMDNLLSNAIKFTHEGTIEFGYELYSENALRFYVLDSGAGIPEDQQEHIFERFRQGDISTSEPNEGTGLGLSISKNLAELLGGKMWFTSKEGEGAIFYFILPYKTTSNNESMEKQE